MLWQNVKSIRTCGHPWRQCQNNMYEWKTPDRQVLTLTWYLYEPIRGSFSQSDLAKCASMSGREKEYGAMAVHRDDDELRRPERLAAR